MNQLPSSTLVHRSGRSRRCILRPVPCGGVPGIAHALLQLKLSRLYEGRVTLFRDLHRSMAEQERNLIDGYAGEQHFDRERVPEHMGMASLSLAVRCSDIRRFEQTAITPLPIGNSAFWISIAAPEEVAGIRLGAGRNVFERLHDVRGERHVDRCPGLCLIEQKAIAI